MSPTHRRRTVLSTFAAVLAFVLCAPIAVNADEVIATEEQILAAAPAAPSWDETSGYGSVEASRVAPSAPSWDDTSGYGAVEASRASIGAEATGHESSAAIGLSWDETSGYGAVEGSRAARLAPSNVNVRSLGCTRGAEYQETPSCSATFLSPDDAAPAAITSQVPSDVRWVPAWTLAHSANPLAAAALAWDEMSG